MQTAIQQDTAVETYQGLRILYAEGEGYHASNGCDSLGYCETVEEIRSEIDDYWAGSEHGPANGIFI